MKLLLRSLLAWVATGFTAYLVYQEASSHNVMLAALWLMPAIAAGTTLWAMRIPAQRRVWRVCWWALTLVAWTTVALVASGVSGLHEGERQKLTYAALLALGTAIWVIVRSQPLPLRQFAADAVLATVSVALGIVGFGLFYEFRTRSIAAQAIERWQEIGRPMAEFEKQVPPLAANESLQVLSAVLQKQLRAGPYKGDGLANEHINFREVMDVLEKGHSVGDTISLSAAETTFLDQNSEQFADSYTQILGAQPAVWAVDLNEGMLARAPHFLALRQLSQLFTADAIRRFSRNDIEGAAKAIAATRQAVAGLQHNPLLVSTMIHVAIDALATAQEVRLPAEEGGMERLKSDVIRTRQCLERSMQAEALIMHRLLESSRTTAAEELERTTYFTSQLSNFPRWLQHRTLPYELRRECALSVLDAAEQLAVIGGPATLTADDLGYARMKVVTDRMQSRSVVSFLRANMRMNATLLLREQSEIIRRARNEIGELSSPKTVSSIVLPNRTWTVVADRTSRSVTVTLNQIPQWIADKQVTSDEFWIAPLDGSKPWQFRAPQTAKIGTKGEAAGMLAGHELDLK